MEPTAIAQIASNAVSALVPFITKGGEKVAGKIAEEGFAQRGKIWETVKGLFDGDELETLKSFEENPEDTDKQADVRGELRRQLKNNHAAAAELAALIKSIPQAQSNVMNVTGNNNQSFQGISGSTINVNRQSDDK